MRWGVHVQKLSRRELSSEKSRVAFAHNPALHTHIFNFDNKTALMAALGLLHSKLHNPDVEREEDRTVVFKIIDTMLTKKKFKDFFNNNVAAL